MRVRARAWKTIISHSKRSMSYAKLINPVKTEPKQWFAHQLLPEQDKKSRPHLKQLKLCGMARWLQPLPGPRWWLHSGAVLEPPQQQAETRTPGDGPWVLVSPQELVAVAVDVSGTLSHTAPRATWVSLHMPSACSRTFPANLDYAWL